MSSLLVSALTLLGAVTTQEQQPAPEVPAGSVEEQQADGAQGSAAPAEPAAPPRNLESLFGGALIGARDAEDFAETPGYRQLLETLSQYTDEELRQKVARRLDVPDAIAHPEAWRGEIVSLRALLAYLRVVRLARPLGEHVDTCRAFVAEADGSEGVVVDFLGERPDLEKHDVVDIEGVFFRTVRYEDTKGGFFEGPYLIARGLRRMDPDTPRNTAFDDLAKILIGAASAYFVVRILFSMRANKKPESVTSSRTIRDRARMPLRPDPPANKL